MPNPEDEHSPIKVSFNDARSFIRSLRKQHKDFTLDLPTLAQLKTALQVSTEIVSMGKEWTQEGWIYDPILNKVDKHPKSGATAAFRVVKNSSEL